MHLIIDGHVAQQPGLANLESQEIIETLLGTIPAMAEKQIRSGGCCSDNVRTLAWS